MCRTDLFVKVRKLDPAARVPVYHSDGAVGADLYALEDFQLGSMPKAIATGIALEFSPGWEAQIRPRSGLSLLGVRVEIGTIDQDFCGSLSVVASAPFGYWGRAGDRIAQLVFVPVGRASLVLTEEQRASTVRGAGGFGSTGV